MIEKCLSCYIRNICDLKFMIIPGDDCKWEETTYEMMSSNK